MNRLHLDTMPAPYNSSHNNHIQPRRAAGSMTLRNSARYTEQPSKKIVHAWALEKDVDPSELKSNTFPLEWPKDSGVIREFPEVDRGEWFGLGEAREKTLKGQAEFIDRLVERLQQGSQGEGRPEISVGP